MAKCCKNSIVIEKWEPEKNMHDGYQIENAITGQILGFCNKEERYTTPLAKKYPLVFHPAIKTPRNWHLLSPGDYIVKYITSHVSNTRYVLKKTKRLR